MHIQFKKIHPEVIFKITEIWKFNVNVNDASIWPDIVKWAV